MSVPSAGARNRLRLPRVFQREELLGVVALERVVPHRAQLPKTMRPVDGVSFQEMASAEEAVQGPVKALELALRQTSRSAI